MSGDRPPTRHSHTSYLSFTPGVVPQANAETGDARFGIEAADDELLDDVAYALSLVAAFIPAADQSAAFASHHMNLSTVRSGSEMERTDSTITPCLRVTQRVDTKSR